MTPRRHRARLGGPAALVVLVACLILSGHHAEVEEDLAVEVVSSRPGQVTGGDALVAVTVPDEVDLDEVEVRADDRPVTDAFATRSTAGDARRLEGLVEGLPMGDSHLTASVGGDTVGLTVTNHPTSGPLFSGDQLPLWACSTDLYGLAPARPEDGCRAPTEVTWEYVDTDGWRHDLEEPGRLPPDAAMLDVGGEEVPYVLRTETGVLNRSVYRVSMLEPRPGSRAEPDTSAWNGRLVYQFGGGCGDTFTQGTLDAERPPADLLERGYIVATSTFNDLKNLCNDAISAETASMVIEHVTETYGEPAHVIGQGSSGGAMQQLLLAQNHPGLLDGLVPGLPYPDLFTVVADGLDCMQLVDHYDTPAGSALDDEKRTAINGHASPRTCERWADLLRPVVDPTTCGPDGGIGGRADEGVPSVPPDEVYDPRSNPEGQRCTLWETNVAVLGRDPGTGVARSPYDNRGVQYGLAALNEGVISFAEFAELNEGVGGFDSDGRPTEERSRAADEALANLHETGRVVGPWGGLPDTPMILDNVYTDPAGDIHDRVRAYSIVDRLAGDGGEVGDGGGADRATEGRWPATVSLWTRGLGATDRTPDDDEAPPGPIVAMDRWLTAAEREMAGGADTWRDALARGKPRSAESRCVLPDGDEIVGPDANAHPECTRAYPTHGEPRMVAGGPRSGDVLACRRRPVRDSLHLYDAELTDAQVERLEEVFPDGVCDYSQPGRGQRPPATTWPDLSRP